MSGNANVGKVHRDDENLETVENSRSETSESQLTVVVITTVVRRVINLAVASLDLCTNEDDDGEEHDTGVIDEENDKNISYIQRQ